MSDYGPGARQGQPGKVPGLPDQRGRRGESVRNMNVPVFSLDLHFEPLAENWTNTVQFCPTPDKFRTKMNSGTSSIELTYRTDGRLEHI